MKFCKHGHQETTCPYCDDKGGRIDPYDFIAVGEDFMKKYKGIKLKMLFVDDRKKRIHYALENFSDKFEVTIAPCVPEALREMSAQDWDVISLDHDLNGYDFQDPDTPTCGMEIVRYIAKTGWPLQRKKPEFWIHSSNLFAAHLMTVSLNEIGLDAWYKPIIYNIEHMKYDEKGIALP